jgi:Amt family ammonium transporter
VAGLVAITPASGYVDPISAIIIGIIASVVCYSAMLFRIRKGLDETCDCWSVHGMGGLTGALLTGVFATAAVQSSYTGLIYGNTYQFLYQVIAVLASVSYSFVVTLVLIYILDKTIGMTVKEEEEYVGLDISQHGERAFS